MGSIDEYHFPLEFSRTKENTIRVYKHRGKQITYAHMKVHDICNLFPNSLLRLQNIYDILASTFVSNLSFIVPNEDGEPSPFSLPMTAVAGRYDASSPLPNDHDDEEQCVRDQESLGEGRSMSTSMAIQPCCSAK